MAIIDNPGSSCTPGSASRRTSTRPASTGSRAIACTTTRTILATTATRRRVLAPRERRHAVGRRCREADPDQGPDAFDLTNMIVPRDLQCAVNECKYVFITGPDGDPQRPGPAPGRRGRVLALARRFGREPVRSIAAAKGMDVMVQEIDVAPVQIQGPNAKKVLADLFWRAGPRDPVLRPDEGRARRHGRRGRDRLHG